MPTTPTTPCQHTPACPPADSPDREAAATISRHPEQGWSLLCNGVLLFEDTGELLPNGQIITPHRSFDAAAITDDGSEARKRAGLTAA
jgi:hypothetical protein